MTSKFHHYTETPHYHKDWRLMAVPKTLATWLPTKSHKARNLALVASPNIWIQLFHVERIETPWNWHSCCHISGQFVDKFTQLDLSSHRTCKKIQRKQGFLSFAPRFALIRTLDHKLSVSNGNQLGLAPETLLSIFGMVQPDKGYVYFMLLNSPHCQPMGHWKTFSPT